MGKLGKKPVKGDSFERPSSLSNQLLTNGVVNKVRDKNLKRHRKNEEMDLKEEKVVDGILSSKIMRQAKDQLNELIEEENEDFNSGNSGTIAKNKKIILKSSKMREEDSDDDSVDFPITNANDYEPEIDEEDEKALKQFMLSSGVVDQSRQLADQANKNRLLSDLIMEKIEEKRFELESQMSQSNMTAAGGPDGVKNLDPRLVEMYKNVGRVLSTYRSGKLPKAFKIIPKLTNWEQILFLTQPENWTAASIYQATRIFVSNLNVKMCQRFLGLILLPRIRDDIAEYKKLNFHLYQALSKGLFKPAAFFKAILLPICESGTCTLREATIIGSLLTKCSIPSLHAAAAMLKIAEMNYSGANSLFLRLLIDKKYTLPFRVIDGLVNHFLRFINDDRQLPVLWHQSLLVFAQRYKADLSTEQKDHLLDLIRKHYHVAISPEIRRELCQAQTRDVEDQEPIVEDVDLDSDISD